MTTLQTPESKITEPYLLFRVQGELYGTPLHLTREVAPFKTPRAIPNTKKNFLGIINLRGEIVSVVDLRIWFQDEKPAMRRIVPHVVVIVESASGVIGVAVDRIEGVYQLDKSDVESPTTIPGEITPGGMLGIGKFKKGLATLLDLNVLCCVLRATSEQKERSAG